jgi:DNA-3-methyladenine glycosylase II
MKRANGIATDDLELPFTPPFDWQRMLRFFRGRATGGVETVDGDVYLRTLDWLGDTGLLSVRFDAQRHCLIARVEGEASRHLPALEPKLARLFDLHTDPSRIQAELAQDPWLSRLLAQAPGLRIPGAWSGVELVVRTIVGQQVSVKAATTIVGRLVQRAGRPQEGPSHPFAAWQFPTPAALAAADLNLIGMPTKRVAALQNFARVVASGELAIDALEPDIPALRAALLALPGIGPWTVEYTAMRAWRDCDAWPGSDLVLMQAIAREHPELLKPGQQKIRSEQWRPWRAYAAMHLWNEIADRAGGERGG